jgi:hypothetical protein
MSKLSYTLNDPAPTEVVRRLRQRFSNLPSDYLDFLLRHDGGEGFLGISPGYFALWSAKDVEQFTREYELHIYLPEYVCIGSSGGGDLYVLPISGEPAGIFSVPAIGMAPDVVELVAPSFSAFAKEFGGEWNPQHA